MLTITIDPIVLEKLQECFPKPKTSAEKALQKYKTLLEELLFKVLQRGRSNYELLFDLYSLPVSSLRMRVLTLDHSKFVCTNGCMKTIWAWLKTWNQEVIFLGLSLWLSSQNLFHSIAYLTTWLKKSQRPRVLMSWVLYWVVIRRKIKWSFQRCFQITTHIWAPRSGLLFSILFQSMSLLLKPMLSGWTLRPQWFPLAVCVPIRSKHWWFCYRQAHWWFLSATSQKKSVWTNLLLRCQCAKREQGFASCHVGK